MNLNEELAEMLYQVNRQISISLMNVGVKDGLIRTKANKLVAEAIKLLRSGERNE